MTTPTDSVVEDRVRAAFEQMMPVILEERDSRVRPRTEEDSSEPLTPDWTVDLVAAGEPQRRTSALLVAFAACVVLVVGGVVLFSRRVAVVDDNPVNEPPAAGDVLLLPPDPVTANELDQILPNSWSSAVQTPHGVVLGIRVSLDYWGELPPDNDVRTIGAMTFGTQLGDGYRDYVALPKCAMIDVTTPATVPTWDQSVIDLMAGLVSNSGAVSVTLPDGWKELATGPQTEYFNTAFSHTIGTSAREMRLFQSRNGSVGQFLSESYRGTATPITFGQSPAWVVHSNDSQQWNYLIWSTGTTAAMLGGQAISDEDLIATAQSLVPTAADEWITRVNATLPPVDPATITSTIVPSEPVGDQSGCGTWSIRFG